MRFDRSPRHSGPPSEATIEDVTRVVLRPMATPLPLGFLALAVGSLLLTAMQLHWISSSAVNSHGVGTVLIVLVAPLEFLTAVVAFLIRDVVMATALGLLAGAWAATGMLLHSSTGGRSQVMGLLAVGIAVAMLAPAIAAAWSKPVAAVITVVAAVRFVVTGVYEMGAGPAWQTVSGLIGVVLLASAAYGSLALTLEDALHRAVLPISRRGTSHFAMTGDLAHQLHGLPSEAGVRQES